MAGKNGKRMTTLHLSQEALDRLKKMKIAGVAAKTMSGVVEDLITRRSNQHADERSERVQMDQAVRVLVKAVCDQLTDNSGWAIDALIDAGMGLPGAIFDRRIGHYADEKQELGSRLAWWILRRAVAFLERGRRVYLVCDSGTTVFWFLKAIGEAISEYCESHSKSTVDLSGLEIVTNSIPGAESFVTYAGHHDVKTAEGPTRIADVVRCRVLGGGLLPEYVAVTGPDTEHDLQRVCEDARSQSDIRPRRETRGPNSRAATQLPVFVGITTGNWIAIQDYEGHLFPHLLARGVGHGPFKRELLRLCDEIFVLAPLGKILLRQDDKILLRPDDRRQPPLVDRLNELLGYTSTATPGDGRGYKVVEMPQQKSSAIKLVTTLREQNSIFLRHSALVSAAIGEYTTLDPNQTSGLTQVSLPIDQVHHLLFPFDLFANDTTEEQAAIELPHPNTRTASFKREFYSIRS